MTDQDLIRVCAELDGWKALSVGSITELVIGRPPDDSGTMHGGYSYCKNYLESYDAIIPLLQKLPMVVKDKIEATIWNKTTDMCVFDATPRQLTIATVKAVGKFKE
jgi:hypothetical protein